MKTKIIPFDLETAKKIQAGEIKGKIVCRYSMEYKPARIICWNRIPSHPIVALVKIGPCYESVFFFSLKGDSSSGGNSLILEVPDKEPQFKPFDKVLMRSPSSGYVCWYPHFYCRYIPDAKDKKPYVSLEGFGYEQCIPYEGHEHLIGTTDKPKEE